MAERATGPQRPSERSERPSTKQGGEKEEKRKGGLGTVLLLVGLIVLSLASGLVAAKIVVNGMGAPTKKRSVPQKEVGAKVMLDEFLVNLAGPDGHYLKTTLAIGLERGQTEESIKDDVPVIRDSILGVLTGKELGDVSTPEGREKLKEEIRSRVNRALGSEKILKIYFTEFMTQ